MNKKERREKDNSSYAGLLNHLHYVSFAYVPQRLPKYFNFLDN